MVVITEVRQIEPAALRGKERDTLRLTWEERRWTRRRAVSTARRAVALALPTGTVLRAGDIIAVEPDWYLAVEARPEPVLAVLPRDRIEAIHVAFEVGNRHFSLAVDGDVLLVPDDTAMEQLLARLGVAWDRREAVYDPIGGGGHRHGTETSPPGGLAHAQGSPAHG
jgi:urease accessory protein